MNDVNSTVQTTLAGNAANTFHDGVDDIDELPIALPDNAYKLLYRSRSC